MIGATGSRAWQAHHTTSFPFLAKGVGRGELGDLTSPPERLRIASQLRDSAGLAPASPTSPLRQTAPGHAHRLNALWLSSRGPCGQCDTSVALARITRPVQSFHMSLVDPKKSLERYNRAHWSRPNSLSVLSIRDEKSERVALSRNRQLFGKLAPRSWATSMEAESRTWMVRCPSCSFERSVWDMGGIRWKASGNKWIWVRCPNCGKRGWHTISRRD
jgi:hypothetical protein